MTMENTITQIVAVYGAIVSSAVLGWTIYRDTQDRGKVRLNCGFRWVMTRASSLVEQDVFVYNVVNSGTRRVLLTHIGGITSEHQFLIDAPELPLALEPGNYHSIQIRDFTDWSTDLKELNCTDSLGNKYKAPKRDVREIAKRLKELKEAGISTSHIGDIRG